MKLIEKITSLFTIKEETKPQVQKTYAVNIIQDQDGFHRIGSNTSYLQEIFRAVSEPQVVFEKKATFLKSGVLKLRNTKTKKEAETHPVLSLMNQPNPMQSLDSFLHSWLYNLDITGESIVYMNTSGLRNVYPFSMYVLSSEKCSKSFNDNYYKQFEMKGIVSNYSHSGVNLEPEKVLHFYNPDPKEFTRARGLMEILISKVDLLNDASNLKKVVYAKKGAIGILSTNAKDSDGAIPLGEKEKKAIIDQYQKEYGTGRGQSSVILSDTPLAWQSMTVPLKDFELEPTRLADFLICIDAFGLDKNAFSFIQGSTFENLKEGMKAVYNNTIIPLAGRFCDEFNKKLGLKEQGLELYFDFSHLDFLKSDAKMQAETQQIQINNIVSLLQNGLITDKEAQKYIQDLGL